MRGLYIYPVNLKLILDRCLQRTISAPQIARAAAACDPRCARPSATKPSYLPTTAPPRVRARAPPTLLLADLTPSSLFILDNILRLREGFRNVKNACHNMQIYIGHL